MNDDFDTDNQVSTTQQEEDFVSKSQLKREAKALQDFARELITLTRKKRESLSLSSQTQNALDDYIKQSGNIAKKRHIAYIAKCLRQDDYELIQQEMEQDNFNQFRNQSKAISNHDELIQSLLEKGDEKIQSLLQSNPNLERQLLRQLVRNIQSAKTEDKKIKASLKLKSFLDESL